MKIYRYLIIGFSVFVMIGMCFFLISMQSGREIEKQQPVAFALTYSIPVPEFVEFCGKKISLDRYDMYERYDREINSFAYLHSSTMLLIKRANRYFPVIEPILKKHNIPDDFKYLAVIESNLNPRAISPANAAGLWQFIAETAKSYGLEVNNQIDERYHIEKSTEAACKYLKEAYSKYGDWSSVAASYNAGMSKISSELNKQMAHTAFDLLLVEETSRYVFRIMAIKEIFQNPYKYGFVLKKNDLYPVIRTKKVEISTDVPDWASFAKENNITYFQLKECNIWLRARDLNISSKHPKTYMVDIPFVEDLYYSKNKVQVHDKAWVTK